MRLQTRRSKRQFWIIALTATLATILGSYVGVTEAVPLRAKIFLTQESIPRNLPEKELISFAQKHQTSRIAETTGSDVKQRLWTATLVIAFNAPPGEMEYQMAFYDIQKGIRILVENQGILLSGSSQKTYLQRIALKRPRYKPNRDMEMVLSVRGQDVGRLRFRVIGEEAVGTGVIVPASKPEKAD